MRSVVSGVQRLVDGVNADSEIRSKRKRKRPRSRRPRYENLEVRRLLAVGPARVDDGLQSLYLFEAGGGSTVFDVSGVGTPVDLTIADPANVTWQDHALTLDSPTFISSLGAAAKLNSAIPATGEVTIEAWLDPANATQTGPARIATLSADSANRNLTLGAGGSTGAPSDAYDVRLRSTSTSTNGLASVSTPAGSLTTDLTHVVYTRSSAGDVNFYINDTLVETGTVAGDLSNWNASYVFGLGNEVSGGRPWLGTLDLVAIYDRALTASEVTQNFDVGPDPGVLDAADDAAMTPAGTPVDIDVLGNDCLGDTPTTVTAVTQGGDGAVATDGSMVTYTPNPGFIGTDTFTYTITDDDGETSTANVSVDVESGVLTSALYASSTSGGNVDGIAFAGEDILLYDFATDSWSMYFDGSDVGLASTNVNAIHVENDGSIFVSTDGNVTLAGLGEVDDSDIIQFEPTSLGDVTSGTWSLFFDGSDVGLDLTSEVIDAISFAPDGRLVLSTNVDYSVDATDGGTLVGFDEDLIVFDDTSLGENTAGTFAQYFDGSDVILTIDGEDIFGVSVDAGTGDLFLTTVGNYSVAGLSGDNDDVFSFSGTIGADTNGTFASLFDGDLLRFANENVDAVAVLTTGTNLVPTARDDDGTTTESNPVTVDVLLNDFPGDGPTTISSVSQGASGGVSTDGTTVTFAPNPGFTGTDTFTYTVTDANGDSSTASVTVTINDRIPLAVDDVDSTFESVSLTIDVLNNDELGTAPTSITAVTQGVGGTVTTDGAIVNYAPDTGFTGADSFTYTITDNNGATSTATASVTVEPNVTLYLSTASPGVVDGIVYAGEDILAYDLATDAWSLLFDGSDVGLGGTDIGALHVNDDGTIFISPDTTVNLVGIGDVENTDVLEFTPASFGEDTAGTWSIFFDGSDVGLSLASDVIDAISFAPDGRLVLSTNVGYSVDATGGGTLTGFDEDLIVFDATTLGADTAGSFATYFDGSDVVMTTDGEDIYGAWIEPVTGEIYLSTIGNYSVNGASGDNDDIFVFSGTTGPDTVGTFSPFFDGDLQRLFDKNLDGLSVGVDVSPPTAELSNPSDGSTVDSVALNSLGFIEVRFDDIGSGLDLSTIDGDEILLSGSGVGTAVLEAGPPAIVSNTDSTFRFAVASGLFVDGIVNVAFADGSFSDSAANLNLPSSESFVIATPDTFVPTGALTDPVDGGSISVDTLNGRAYLDVTFTDVGDGLDTRTIDGDELMLSGPGVGSATLSTDMPILVPGTLTTYRYPLAGGQFVEGAVQVDFVAGAFADLAGNLNQAASQGFDVAPPPPVVQLVDDGDTGFFAPSTWATFPLSTAFDGDHTFLGGNGTGTATWTFPVQPGLYRVSTFWPHHPNRSQQARFTISGGDNGDIVVLVNQELTPTGGPAVDGKVFQNLGDAIAVGGDTLTVALDAVSGDQLDAGGAGDSYVVADAVRVERILEVAPPTGALTDPVDGGSINVDTLNGRGYLDVTFTDVGDGLDTRTIDGDELMLSGPGVGSATLSTDMPILVPGTLTTYRYPLAGGQFVEGAVQVDFVAGAFADLAGNLNQAASQGFDVAPPPPVVQLVDDGDTGFFAPSTWATFPLSTAFDGDHTFLGGNGTGTATWTFPVQPGLYRVSTFWPHHPNRSQQARFTISGGDNGDIVVLVNQELAPTGGPAVDGKVFQNLGDAIAVGGDTLTVALDAVSGDQLDAGGAGDSYVVADAVRVERLVITDSQPLASDDSASTTEGIPVTIDALANDVLGDPPTTITAVSQGASGSVTTDGSAVTYTPNPGFSGNDSFTYTITDSDGDAASATINLTVERELDAVDDSSSTAEASAVVVTVLANDALGDAPTSISGVTQGGDGTVTTDGTTVTYTPDPGFIGTDRFTYTITDSDGDIDTATVTIDVDPLPTPPQIYISSSSGGFVDAVTFADEDILLFDMALDTWSMHFDGSDVGLGNVDVGAFHITETGEILLSLDSTINIPGIGDVTNNDILQFTPTSLGNITAGTFSLFFDGSDVGLSLDSEVIDAISIAPDGRLVLSTNVDYSVPATGGGTLEGFDEDLIVFDAVTLGNDTAGTFAQYFDGSDVILTINGEDIYGASIDGSTGELFLTTIGNYSVTGLSGDNDDIFRFTGSVGADTSGSFSALFDGDALRFADKNIDGVTVITTGSNDVIPSALDDVADTTESTPVTVNVLSNDFLGNLPSSITGVTQGAGGGVTTDGTTVTYTPNGGFTGDDSFAYTITDDDGDSSTATVNVTVSADSTPDAVDDSATTGESTAVTVNVLANDSLGDLPTSITAVTQGTSGTVTTDGDTVAYTPNPGFTGSDSFTYTITDNDGDTDTATVDVTVNTSSSSTVLFVSGSTGGLVDGISYADEDILRYDVASDSWSLHFDGSDVGLGGVDVNAFHINDDGTIFISTSATSMLPGLTVDNSDVVQFTPTSLGATTAGTFSLFFDGSDVGLTPGTEVVDAVSFAPDGRLVVSTNADFSVDATGGGTLDGFDEDLIVFDAVTLGADTAGTFAMYLDGGDVGLTSGGEDIYGASIDSSTGVVYLTTIGNVAVSGLTGDNDDVFAFSGTTGPNTSGTFTPLFDGDLSRLPNKNIDGVTVISGSFNANPSAADDAGTTVVDTPVQIDVLSNDFPGDTPTSITGVTQGASGGVSTDGTTVTYTPDGGFIGDDSFTYTITDDDGETSTATVNITVDAISLPSATDDSATTQASTLVTIDVLANDDLGMAPTTITGVTQGGDGSVTIDGTGVSYTPDLGFTGIDTFTYTITDSAGETSTANVSVTVSGGSSATQLYLSSSSNGTVDGIAFQDEDILVYDMDTDSWQLHFDGSDVGLGGNQDVDAFHVTESGTILLSLGRGATLDGVAIDDSDIVEFTPTSLGETTSGSFSLFFDGSSFLLDADGEDIDAIGFASDGRLLISTTATFSVDAVGGGTLTGADEDVIALDDAAGAFEVYFDGSDVALTTGGEDVTGLWVDNEGSVFLTTLGNYAVGGLSGDSDDLFRFDGTTGETTSGTFSEFFDGDTAGFGGESIDGLSLVNAAAGTAQTNRFDTNGDDRVTAGDALRVINRLALFAEGEDVGRVNDATDVNRDGRTTTLDALIVMGYLSESQQEPSSEAVVLDPDGAMDDEEETDEVIEAIDLALTQGLF